MRTSPPRPAMLSASPGVLHKMTTEMDWCRVVGLRPVPAAQQKQRFPRCKPPPAKYECVLGVPRGALGRSGSRVYSIHVISVACDRTTGIPSRRVVGASPWTSRFSQRMKLQNTTETFCYECLKFCGFNRDCVAQG